MGPKHKSGEFFVEMPDGTRQDADLHAEMLDGVDDIDDVLEARERAIANGVDLATVEALWPLCRREALEPRDEAGQSDEGEGVHAAHVAPMAGESSAADARLMARDNLCRRIYAETAAFYEEIRPALGGEAFGFRILYGPPVRNPPVLILGFQPGMGAKFEQEDDQAQMAGWPDECVYASASWPLARHLRHMFGESMIAQATGLNAVFIRAQTMSRYGRIDIALRRRIRDFCLPRAEAMVQAMAPTRVLVLGLHTLGLFGDGQDDLRSPTGRVLTKTGHVGGAPAIGVLHLSGARISSADRAAIARRVLEVSSS